MSVISGERLTGTSAETTAQELELSIIMPCLNEAETLETCIRKAAKYLQENNINGEIVIGDNGSTDGSQDIARRCGARVVPVAVRGYGAALYPGISRLALADDRRRPSCVA